MEKVQRSMLKLCYDSDEQLKYTIKAEDEATKNHSETDQTIQTAFMPANPGDRMCAVRSYKMYISHLHPDNPFLWQTPNLNPPDPGSNIWYT